MSLCNQHFIVLDVDLKPLAWSDAWPQVLGLSVDRLQQISCLAWAQDDEKAALQKAFERAQSGSQPSIFVGRFLDSQKNVVQLQWSLQFLPEEMHYLVSLQDITELHRLQTHTKQMESVTKIGWWELDWETKKIFWSPGIHKIYGTDPLTHEHKVGDFVNYYAPESAEKIRQAFSDIEKGITPEPLEVLFKSAPGQRPRWARIVARADRWNGKIVRVYGTTEDITDETLARQSIEKFQSQLMDQNERLQLANKALKFGVWDWNVQTNKVEWDNTLYEMYNMSHRRNEDANLLFRDAVVPEDFNWILQNAREVFARKEIDYNIQYRLNTIPVRHIKTTGICFYDDQGHIQRVVGSSWDITDMVSRETMLNEQRIQLVESAKLASLGEMAGGISHEINNPLAIIKTRAGIMNLKISNGQMESQDLLKDVAQIESTVDRIAQIISGLRAITRNTSMDPMESVPVRKLIDETLIFCQEKIKIHRIHIRIECAENLSVLCRPSQIEQILLNLIRNSIEAIENSDKKWIEVTATSTLNGTIQLRVRDSGRKIPEEISKNFMQPFFSTKPPGKGTGLGLSISKGLAEANLARLSYHPSDEHTCFQIEFRSPQNH